MCHKVYAGQMGSWVDRQSTDGHINDTCDGDVFKQLMQEMGGHVKNMVVCIYYDPFQPFKANAKYSSAPLVCVIQNLPSHLRWEHGAVHLMGIQEGESEPGCKVSKQPMLELACDELEYLGLVGITVQDASTNQPIR